jgi:hypothetical protein
MKFNICFGNIYLPNASEQEMFWVISVMAPMAKYLKLALEANGHEAHITRNFVDPGAINIFFERFRMVEHIRQIKASGCRYGLICTEPMADGERYNAFEHSGEIAKQFYETFAASATDAEFVWYLLEPAEAGCKRLNSNSHLLEFGHVPGFANLKPPQQRQFEIDCLISGREHERRAAVAKELVAKGLSVVLTAIEPDIVRDDLLERARATLHVQKSEQHNIFSISRIHHSISNEVPILVEYDGPPSYLASYCIAVPKREFVEACVAFAKADHRAHAAKMLERFQREKPVSAIIPKLLRQSGLEGG